VDDAEPFPISPVSNPVPREDNFKRALLVNFCVAPGLKDEAVIEFDDEALRSFDDDP
jgi:hypothetical protein